MSYSKRIRKWLCIGGAAVLTVSLSPSAVFAQARYEVTDLGSLGGLRAGANAINELGQAAGTFRRPDGTEVAFLWDQGELILLPPAANLPESIAYGLNNRSEVVGVSQGFPNQPDRTLATVWRRGVPVGLPFEDYATLASDINDAGLIVGSRSTWTGPALLWINDRAYLLPGGDGGANAVNEVGQIAGYRQRGFYHSWAVMWDLGKRTMNRIGTDLNSSSDRPSGVNDFGVVAFTSVFKLPSSVQAHLWIDGRSERLPPLPNTEWARVLALNNRNVAVGACGNHSEFSTFWENGEATALNDLIDPESGWYLMYARDINEMGQIVGEGAFELQRRAFLLTPRDMMRLAPPEPGRSGEVNTIVVQGATPDAMVSLFYSLDPGFTAIPECDRLGLNLDGARFVAQARADGQGRATIEAFIPNRGAGLTVYLQAVETTGLPQCRQTNLVRTLID